MDLFDVGKVASMICGIGGKSMGSINGAVAHVMRCVTSVGYARMNTDKFSAEW